MMHEGQGFHISEAGKETHDKVSVRNVPGSKAMAGDRKGKRRNLGEPV